MLNIETAPLGVLPDPVIAEQVGQHRRSPAERRKRAGIRPSTEGRMFERLCEWIRTAEVEAIVEWCVCIARCETPQVLELAVSIERPEVWTQVVMALEAAGEYVG